MIKITCEKSKKELSDKALSVDAVKLFGCSYCGLMFQNLSKLAIHEAFDHLPQPRKNFTDQYQSDPRFINSHFANFEGNTGSMKDRMQTNLPIKIEPDSVANPSFGHSNALISSPVGGPTFPLTHNQIASEPRIHPSQSFNLPPSRIKNEDLFILHHSNPRISSDHIKKENINQSTTENTQNIFGPITNQLVPPSTNLINQDSRFGSVQLDHVLQNNLVNQPYLNPLNLNVSNKSLEAGMPGAERSQLNHIHLGGVKEELLDKAIAVDVEEELFNCSYCGEIFHNKFSLVDHEAEKHPLLLYRGLQNDGTNECRSVEDHFNTTELMHRTKNGNNNSEENEIQVTQSINLSSEKIKKELLDKAMSVGTEELFDCSFCGAVFNNKLALTNHEAKSHKTSSFNNRLQKDSTTLPSSNLHDLDHQRKEVQLHESIDIDAEIIKKELGDNVVLVGSDESFNRSYCGSIFHSKTNLINHEIQMHPPSVYNCKNCCFTTPRESVFKLHCMTHFTIVSENKIFACDECSKVFKRPHLLNAHKKKRHSNLPKDFKCDELNCDFATKYAKTIETHKLRHKKKKKVTKIPCKVASCSETFASKCGLDRHILYRHSDTLPSESVLTCESCPQKFSNREQLDKHIQSHTNSNEYKCSQCSKVYRCKKRLSIHFSASHTSKYFVCTECPDKFKTKANLMRHAKKHESIHQRKTYSCNQCDKKFRLRVSLDRHAKNHSAKYFECDYCGYQAKLKELLKRHIIRIHSRKYNYKCKERGCTKRFKLNIDYQWHMKKYHDKSDPK